MGRGASKLPRKRTSLARPFSLLPPPPGRMPEHTAPPTCSCGHEASHYMVSAEASYGFWAWVALLLGISGTPKQVTWRCRRCGEVIHTTRDPNELQDFR